MLNKPLHTETKKACLSQLPSIKHRIWLPEHRMCQILNWCLTAVLDCSWVNLQGLSSLPGEPAIKAYPPTRGTGTMPFMMVTCCSGWGDKLRYPLEAAVLRHGGVKLCKYVPPKSIPEHSVARGNCREDQQAAMLEEKAGYGDSRFQLGGSLRKADK